MEPRVIRNLSIVLLMIGVAAITAGMVMVIMGLSVYGAVSLIIGCILIALSVPTFKLLVSYGMRK